MKPKRLPWLGRILFLSLLIGGFLLQLQPLSARCLPPTVCCQAPKYVDGNCRCIYGAPSCVGGSACTGEVKFNVVCGGGRQTITCPRQQVDEGLCGGGGGGGSCRHYCDGGFHPACDLRVLDVGSTTARLAWRQGTDGKVTLYVCRNDGSRICDVRASVRGRRTYLAQNLKPNTPYKAYLISDSKGIDACDISGPRYVWSNKVYFTTTGSPPTCSLSNLASTIGYKGLAYYDITRNGAFTVREPSTYTATISVSDPDGGAVQVTEVTASKPECLQVTHSNTTVRLTPQGALTGQPNPPLDTANTCRVTVTATVRDEEGETATCSKDITVTYPQPRVSLIRLRDQNPVYIPGEDATPRNLLTDVQFATVGGAYRDPFTTSGAQVDNPDQPTRTLKPLEQRFSITGYTHSDHNAFGAGA